MNEPGSSELPAENVGCKPKILESIHGPASTSTCKYVKPGSVMHKKTEASPEGLTKMLCQSVMIVIVCFFF